MSEQKDLKDALSDEERQLLDTQEQHGTAPTSFEMTNPTPEVSGGEEVAEQQKKLQKAQKKVASAKVKQQKADGGESAKKEADEAAKDLETTTFNRAPAAGGQVEAGGPPVQFDFEDDTPAQMQGE